MKVGENVTRILCYGDSNTWGQKPLIWEKYEDNVIWTKLLEEKLGTNFKVYNEGLSGRCAGDIDIAKSFHNGLEHFLSHTYTRFPFDIVIIALGTNDLQYRFNQTASDIFNNLMSYQEKLNFMINDDSLENRFKMIYLSPPIITKDTNKGDWFESANEKNIELCKLLDTNQVKFNYNHINCNSLEVTGEDGVHFSPEDHNKVANRICNTIKKYA